MPTSSSRRSNGTALPMASTFQRSLSPSTRFYTPKISDSSSFFTSCSSPSSKSPTHVNFHGLVPVYPTPSVCMSIDRSTPPGQVLRKPSGCKRTCLCSPTTHPGSFRCSLHKNLKKLPAQSQVRCHTNAYSLKNLTIQRSAMKNSLVRIGTVEGDLVKRALAALIRPASHQIRRRADFQSKPSRLSVMSTSELSYESINRHRFV